MICSSGSSKTNNSNLYGLTTVLTIYRFGLRGNYGLCGTKKHGFRTKKHRKALKMRQKTVIAFFRHKIPVFGYFTGICASFLKSHFLDYCTANIEGRPISAMPKYVVAPFLYACFAFFFSVAISAFMILISSASYSSHSFRVLAYTFLEMRLLLTLGVNRPSDRWSLIIHSEA